MLHYAIADVGWFVRPGDPLDVEAFERGVTVYLPDERSTLYPTILSEGAASLLPDVDRPAVVFTVSVDPGGITHLEGVERALIRSTAKLAYDAVGPDDLPDGFDELHRRITVAEIARGAPRVEFPEQEIERTDDGRFTVRFRPRLPSEEQNAAMSLATNLAVADALHAAGTGLFRVMPEVDERRMRSPPTRGASVRSRLADGDVARRVRAIAASRRPTDLGVPDRRPACRRRRRATHRSTRSDRPWHSAVAATYAQATAPLRRLQDRYVDRDGAGGRERSSGPTRDRRRVRSVARGDGERRTARRTAPNAWHSTWRRRSCSTDTTVRSSTPSWSTRGSGASRCRSPNQRCSPGSPPDRVDPGDEMRVRLTSVDVERRTVEFERVS